MDLRTLVFVDVESTHLPNRIPPFGPPRVTEIALLACRIKQFKRPFRVTDRISLCVRPPENIYPDTTEITGLDNYNLEEQRTFGEMTSTLKSFLLTLDQPICFVAHNGDKFDFPLIKAELEACDQSWSDLDIHTCDSLDAFRFILPQYPEDHFSISASEFELEQQQSIPDQDPLPEGMCTPPKNPKFDMEMTPPDSDDRGMRTPPRSQQAPRPNHPPAAPLKKRTQGRFLERGPNGKLLPKRSYKLGDIYKRLYQEAPVDAHQALGDCEMLFKCCLLVRRDFMQFLETRRGRFSEVVPMWSRRARKEITTRSGRVLATPTKKNPRPTPSTPVRTNRKLVARRIIQVYEDVPDSEAFQPLDSD